MVALEVSDERRKRSAPKKKSPKKARKAPAKKVATKKQAAPKQRKHGFGEAWNKTLIAFAKKGEMTMERHEGDFARRTA